MKGPAWTRSPSLVHWCSRRFDVKNGASKSFHVKNGASRSFDCQARESPKGYLCSRRRRLRRLCSNLTYLVGVS